MEFENLYITTRQKENRIYSDLEIKRLPFIESAHPHSKEWKIRSQSAARLVKYLENKKRSLSILEVGCGNGWLSSLLAGLENSYITGTDINQCELNQAERVFSGRANLEFIMGDLENLTFDKKFDIVIFAASIQYFPVFRKVISQAMALLHEGGEIHILDSYFYAAGEDTKAAARSSTYFRSLGIETMTHYYFHHNVALLQEFRYRYLFNPDDFRYRIFGNRNPFPWICITS